MTDNDWQPGDPVYLAEPKNHGSCGPCLVRWTAQVDHCPECGELSTEALRAAVSTQGAEAEPRHEVDCPECGATIRARMTDTPTSSGDTTTPPPRDFDTELKARHEVLANHDRRAAARAGIAERGDAVEAWLKRARQAAEGDRFWAIDDLLDDYRLHADTGAPLDQHACERCHDCRDEATCPGASYSPQEEGR